MRTLIERLQEIAADDKNVIMRHDRETAREAMAALASARRDALMEAAEVARKRAPMFEVGSGSHIGLAMRIAAAIEALAKEP